MRTEFDFASLKVSWTKYDIVRVLDVFESKEALETYYKGEAYLDRPILKSVLGISSNDSPIPEFWYDVIDDLQGKEKLFFVFFAILFTNSRILKSFAQCYNSPFRGEYHLADNKESTNTRSLLVESGLSSATFRRKDTVPFDGSILLNSSKAGRLFKKFLQNLIFIHSKNYYPEDFEDICREYHLNESLGLPLDRFFKWLNGEGLTPERCRSLEFTDFLCFDGYNSLDFGNSREIYLVGENGDGKSLLLLLIFMAFNGHQIRKNYDAKNIGDAVSWLDRCNDTIRGIDDLDQRYSLESAPSFKNFYAYGTHRGLYASDGDAFLEPHGFMTLFNNNLKLINPIEWLKGLYIKCSEGEICSENSFSRISDILSELLENKVTVKMDGSDISFIEKDYELKLEQLSEGYRSVIIMACDLFARMMENNDYNVNIFDTPGVVLIDEICQHLHPRWQREIVSKLRRIFKNMQFIVTTHSPFVIQGASDESIAFRVYRENGHAYISDAYKVSQMKNMMLNTLATSSMFGVDSAAMEGAESIDTSDSYIVSRINAAVRRDLEDLRKQGHNFLSEEEVDVLVRKVMEAQRNDKDL